MTAGLERCHDVGARRLDAAHALDDELDLLVRENLVEARGHAGVAQAVGQLEDVRHLDAVHMLGDDLVDSAANRPVAEDGNLHGRPIFRVCVGRVVRSALRL